MQCLLNKVSDNTVCMWKQSLDLQCGMCLVMRPVDCWNKNLHHEQEFLGFGPKTKVVMYTIQQHWSSNKGSSTLYEPFTSPDFPLRLFHFISFFFFYEKVFYVDYDLAM